MVSTVKELSMLWNCKSQLTEGIETNKLITDHLLSYTIKQTIYDMPVVKSNGLKSAAGKAIFKHPHKAPHIRLHSALYDNADEVVSQRLETFFHEIAHQIAYLTKHDRGHGPYWAYSLMHFGFPPKRCYDGAVSNFRGYKRRNENRGVEDTIKLLDDILGGDLI